MPQVAPASPPASFERNCHQEPQSSADQNSPIGPMYFVAPAFKAGISNVRKRRP